MFNQEIHRRFFFFFLLLLSVGLSFGKLLMSISIIGLFVNWLFEGKFREKWRLLLQNKSRLIFIIALYLLEVVWVVFSANYTSSFNSLRIKLPIIVLPLVLGTTPLLNAREWKWLIFTFLLALISSTGIALLVKYDIIEPKNHTNSTRDLSIFMSHIRYSTLLAIGFFLSIYLFVLKKTNLILTLILSAAFLFTLYQINSFTTYIGIALSLIYLTAYFFIKIKSTFKVYLMLIALIFFTVSIFYMLSIYHDFNTPKKVQINSDLPMITAEGNTYFHDTLDLTLENGYYLWRNIAEQELLTKWNKRSHISFDGLDQKGQEIKYTLYRYLTSKGLKKDANGLAKLGGKDIQAIESGETTALNYNLFEKRLRAIFFELQQYKQSNDPNNQTLTQRFIYWKTAINCIKKEMLFGHGTGGYKSAIRNEYITTPSNLAIKNQKYPHNQLLTQLINMGIIGFILWFFCLIFPVYQSKIYTNPMFVVFSLLMTVSLLSDDMFERQAGVCIFIFFYTLLITQSEVIKSDYFRLNRILNRSS